MNAPQIVMLILVLLSVGLQFRWIYKDLTNSSGMATFLMFVAVVVQTLFCGLLHWGGFW